MLTEKLDRLCVRDRNRKGRPARDEHGRLFTEEDFNFRGPVPGLASFGDPDVDFTDDLEKPYIAPAIKKCPGLEYVYHNIKDDYK